MKKVLVLLAMISIVFVIGCTKKVDTCTITEKDGVKIYKNKNIPTVEKLEFNPVKKFTINNDSTDMNYITYSDFDLISIDSKEKLFIADVAKPKVNMYDKEGKFVKTFVKQGLGPGEITSIAFLTIKNDTIYIGDRNNGTVSKFNTSGEFIEKFKPDGEAYQVRAVGKNKFICFTIKYEQVDKGWMLIYELTLLNNSFEPVKKFNRLKFLAEDMSAPDIMTYLTVTDDKIYVAVNDKIYYKVNVYDHDGNLIEELYKSYTAINITDEEFNRMSEYLTRTNQGQIKRNKMRKKRAVVGVFEDKNGNIIIHPAVDTSKGKTKGIVLDFFKDNIYLNTYIFEKDKPYSHCDFNTFIDFMGDKMYKYDSGRSILEVYEY